MNPLQLRLAGLRRWLRFVVTFRGLCWALTFLLAAAALAGWIDWRIHLPSLVRAVVLVGTLAGVGYVVWRFLIRPLRVPVDDLSLALRVEALHPSLKDGLASTVQFLEQPDDSDRLGSPTLRREVVGKTLRQSRHLNWNRVVNTRGMPSAGLSLVLSGVLTFLLLFLYPAQAWTALVRLAHPFGSRDWPRETRLEIQAPTRVARGEPVEIQGLVVGVVPAQAVVEYQSGSTVTRQTCPIMPGREPDTGTLTPRRERAEKTFRFQVRAHDAVSEWREVVVVPPPVLVPHEGRPSPRVHLQYPAYTDLPEQDLPDGFGNVEAVMGTVVRLQAATDRAVARAWIEYHPTQPLTGLAAFLTPLGASHLACVLSATAGGQSVWDRVPVRLDPTGRLLTAAFLPRASGAFALRFEDDSGLGNQRLFELRLFRDPEPVVHLDRPSPVRDSLDVLPNAEITLRIRAEDVQFALRTAFIEYRTRQGDEPRQLPLYDHAAMGNGLPRLLAALALKRPVGVPHLRLRPQQLQIARRLSLEQIAHLDRSPLKEGDILVIQGCATDFDDVAVDKKPGHSHEVELRIVSRATLEGHLNKAESEVQQELLRLRKKQQEALKQVIGPEQQWRNTGRLEKEDVKQLLAAETAQKDIHQRVGTPREGLRAQVGRILQALKDNRLPRSGTQERMETVADELERLERKELQQIEPHLTRARKEAGLQFKEGVNPPRKPSADQKGPLTEARSQQEEVENTLAELLKLLEPWGNINEIKGEARSLLQEQRKLLEETKTLDTDETRGREPEGLTAEQKAALDKTAEFQNKLGDRTAELQGKMERLGRERQTTDPGLAAALTAAADKGKQEDVSGQMKNAGQKVRGNQLGEAGQAQQKALQGVEEIVQALEERREKELEQLRKKLKEVERQLDDLTQRQEQLRKKMKEAGKIADPQKRQQELRRLAREQEQLRKEAQQMVRELSRLRMEQAKQALGEAGASMERAGQQLERNEETDEAQEETLDRLNETKRAIQKQNEEIEEELAREKLARAADQIKRLKERQDAALAEGERIQREVLQKKEWERGLLISLKELAQNQKDLSDETDSVAKGKLAQAQVFARILTRAADAMKQAGEKLESRFEQAKETPDDLNIDAEAPKRQREAVRRIEQLLEAIQPEKGQAQRPSGRGDGPPGGGASKGGGGEGLGFLAQLKGLKILQQEVNERTETFGKQHPDPAKLKPEQLRELQELGKEQEEISKLLDELTKPGEPEGDKP